MAGAYDAATSAAIARHFVDGMVTPSQVAIRQEMVSQVEAALEKMDDIDREILALRHFEEMRNGEVAELLSISDAAASNRYMRALKRLRECLNTCSESHDE